MNIDQETASSGPEAGENKWTVLGIVAIGVFMATLDASIVNISLPKISLSFHAPLNGMVEWVIIAYLVVIVSLLLSLGRLSDVVGRKLLWLAGIALFTVGSALCGAAPSLFLLVILRGLQGVGGAIIMAISPAMITRAFPPSERGRALGINAFVVAAGTSAGPAIGGFITEWFTWRWIFYINVPIGIFGIAAALCLLKEKMPWNTSRGQFDPLGALLLSIGMTCLMLAISFGQEVGWHSVVIIALFSVAAVCLIMFIPVERRVKHPIVDLSLFRNRLFTAAISSSFLSFLSLFAVVFLMPFYLEELLGFPPDQAGLILTAVPLTISVVAPMSGWLSDRLGSRGLSSLGMAVASAGLWFLSDLTHRSSIVEIVWPLVVTGFGQALFQAPNNNAIMGSVPLNRVGIASGFLATVRVLGQASSVALAGAIFIALGGAEAGAVLNRRPAPSVIGPVQHTFTFAFHMALFVCMAIASVSVLTSLMRGQARGQ